jgi:hypothetical protein
VACLIDVGVDRYLLASGGDDNALTVTLCRVTLSTLTRLYQHCHPLAHAAAITAVVGIAPGMIATTGADCRLNLWQLRETGEELVCHDTPLGSTSELTHVQVDSQLLGVHDIQALDYNPRYVLVLS